jgi:Uncharacterized protein conserved in bacteria
MGTGTPSIANHFKVIITKSKYELKVFDEDGWLYTYPVVFGSSEMRDKMMEGDNQTPEGHFKIVHKKIHPDGGLFCCWITPIKKALKDFNCVNLMVKFLLLPNPAAVSVFMLLVIPKKTAL